MNITCCSPTHFANIKTIKIVIPNIFNNGWQSGKSLAVEYFYSPWSELETVTSRIKNFVPHLFQIMPIFWSIFDTYDVSVVGSAGCWLSLYWQIVFIVPHVKTRVWEWDWTQAGTITTGSPVRPISEVYFIQMAFFASDLLMSPGDWMSLGL